VPANICPNLPDLTIVGTRQIAALAAAIMASRRYLRRMQQREKIRISLFPLFFSCPKYQSTVLHYQKGLLIHGDPNFPNLCHHVLVHTCTDNKQCHCCDAQTSAVKIMMKHVVHRKQHNRLHTRNGDAVTHDVVTRTFPSELILFFEVSRFNSILFLDIVLDLCSSSVRLFQHQSLISLLNHEYPPATGDVI